jgi:hypothetical protein
LVLVSTPRRGIREVIGRERSQVRISRIPNAARGCTDERWEIQLAASGEQLDVGESGRECVLD